MRTLRWVQISLAPLSLLLVVIQAHDGKPAHEYWPVSAMHKHALYEKGMDNQLYIQKSQDTGLEVKGVPGHYLAPQQQQHNPEHCIPVYVPEHKRGNRKPCTCYEQVDPCSPQETRACGAYCDKKKCGCCDDDLKDKPI